MFITLKIKSDKFQVQIQPQSTVLQLKQKISDSKGYPIQQQNIMYQGSILLQNNTIQSLNIKPGQILLLIANKQKQIEKKPQNYDQSAFKKKPKIKKSKISKIPQSSSSQIKRNQKSKQLNEMDFQVMQAKEAYQVCGNKAYEADQFTNKIQQKKQDKVNIDSNQQKKKNINKQIRIHQHPKRKLLLQLLKDPKLSQTKKYIKTNPNYIQVFLQSIKSIDEQLYKVALGDLQGVKQLVMQQNDDQQNKQQIKPNKLKPNQQANRKRLKALIQKPQFQSIKQQLRNNPEVINFVIKVFSQSIPQLYQLIIQDVDEFKKMLVSENIDNQAIERLMQLGFTKSQASIAYEVCDKNQQVAAQFLFTKSKSFIIQ